MSETISPRRFHEFDWRVVREAVTVNRRRDRPLLRWNSSYGSATAERGEALPGRLQGRELLAEREPQQVGTVCRIAEERRARDGRYPHVTAVIAETKSGSEWAVDPWSRAPGEKPDILPLSQWRQDS